jgi:hypothetical protein
MVIKNCGLTMPSTDINQKFGFPKKNMKAIRFLDSKIGTETLGGTT